MSLQLRVKAHTVDLRIESDARVLCLFGPSGSGKTTCLEAVAGLLRPARARIRIGGRDLADLPPRLRRVGYVPQDAPLFPHLSVRRNVLYGLPDADPMPVAEALDIAGLLDRAPRRLSGGERRRVALGRAILARPEVLLLDEPFGGVDARLRADLLVHIARLDTPHVLLVTHDPRDALGLADEVVRLEKGRAVAQGPPDEIFGPHSELVEPAALLRGRVTGTSGSYVQAEVAGGTVHAHLPGAAAGEQARLAIRADDVTIALKRHDDMSARNQIGARVTAIERSGEQALAVLDAGVRLYALLDPRSARTLGLKPGSKVVAAFKASALKRAGL